MFSLTIGTKQLKVSNVDHRNSVENVTAEIGMVVDLLCMVVKRNILNASRCGFNGWKAPHLQAASFAWSIGDGFDCRNSSPQIASCAWSQSFRQSITRLVGCRKLLVRPAHGESASQGFGRGNQFNDERHMHGQREKRGSPPSSTKIFVDKYEMLRIKWQTS